MFKRVISHPGFWKSVAVLAVSFAMVFTLIKGILEGFDFSFILNNPWLYVGGIIVASFVYAFIVTFGKFRNKIKSNH